MPTLEFALSNETSVDSRDIKYDRSTDGAKTLRDRIAEVASVANSAVQPGDNVSALTNDAGYLASLVAESLGSLSDVDLTGIADRSVLIWDGSAFTPRISPDYKQVFNSTGSTIQSGRFVEITGVAGALPTIALADQDTSTAVAGVTIADIPAGAAGLIQLTGTIQEAFINTLTLTAGSPLYLGSGGGYLDTPPAGNVIQVGVVGVVASSSGSILLDCPATTKGGSAAAATYDNSSSGLTATNVQSAIDEIDNTIDGFDFAPEPPAGGTVYGRSNAPDSWVPVLTTSIYDPQGIAADAFARANHTGTIDVGDLDASGTASSSTYLRGDGAWATPSGTGGVDTNETTVSPSGGGDGSVAWNGSAYADSGTTATHATNTSPSRDDLTSSGTGFTDVTLLGVPGKQVTQAASFHGFGNWNLPGGMSNGQVVYFVILFQYPGAETIQFRVGLNGGPQDSVRLNTDGTVTTDGWGDNTGSLENPTTANNAYNQVVTLDGANDIYLAQMRLAAVTDLSASTIEVYVNTSGSAETFSVAPIYRGATAVDGDSDAILIPGVSGGGSSTLTLTSDANQAATISANADLVLPSAPSSDVRDIVVRVTVSGGQLSLPSSGVAVFGESGPFSSNVRLAIRQYGDGSDADIYAVTEVV